MSANKILIADDDRVVHESLSIYLKAEGYEVVDAYNGAEAIEKLDAEIALCVLTGFWALNLVRMITS